MASSCSFWRLYHTGTYVQMKVIIIMHVLCNVDYIFPFTAESDRLSVFRTAAVFVAV